MNRVVKFNLLFFPQLKVLRSRPACRACTTDQQTPKKTKRTFDLSNRAFLITDAPLPYFDKSFTFKID